MSGIEDGTAAELDDMMEGLGDGVTGVEDAAGILGIGPEGPLTPATATILSGT